MPFLQRLSLLDDLRSVKLPGLPRNRSYLLITSLDNPSEVETLGLAATAGSSNEEPDRYKSAVPGILSSDLP